MSSTQQLILGEGAGGAPAGYQISRSLRFNSADSAYLSRTPASAGNRDTWTYSAWIKRSVLSTNQTFFSARSDGNNYDYCSFNTSDQFSWAIVSGGSTVGRLITTQVFRDVSSWYHFLITYDSGNATGGNRMRFYVNGTEVTAFGTDTNPSQNQDSNINNTIAHDIGRFGNGTEYCNYYQTETYFIDGQALTPSSFGQTNASTGVWEPIAYTGTYGTNGFYLNFSDNSNTTSTTLGKDYSGNGNNWTPNLFSVTAGADNDSLVDTPTPYGTDTGVGGEVRGNYATFNSVKPVTNSITFSNGNLQYKPGSSWSTTTYVEGTIGILGGSTGKYYWEMSSDQAGNLWTAGVALQNNTIGNSNIGTTGSVMIYDADKYVNGTATGSYLTQLSANEVLGVALDAATGKVWFRDSGGWLGSGDPAAGTNETGIPTGFSGATLVPVSQANSASTVTANFGQRPFAYAAPSGFKALCTQNLPTPTIGATSTTQANDYFNTVLYTGTGSSLSVTGVGFQPDFVWIKERAGAADHGLYDAVRGVQKQLESNTTTAETTETTGLTAFGTDGFTVGALAQLNTNTDTYVAWNWKANGAGSSNTDGTITSTVSANTTAGFSVLTYNPNNTSGTIGHGLGVAPQFIIVRSRTNSGGDPWGVYHVSLGNTKYLRLNTTDGEATLSTVWNNTSPTSTVVSIGTSDIVSSADTSFIMYCFAPVAGYSAFGSYTGNASADGPFIYTDFRPKFVMIKCSSTTGDWVMEDVARSPYNVSTNYLVANASTAEQTGQLIDFVSNGFKIRVAVSGAMNSSGATYIYAAFAESPFKYSLGR